MEALTTKYILAIDQGSSGTMVGLFDQYAKMIDYVDIPVSISTSHYCWVEYDPFELISSIKDGTKKLMARYPYLIENLVGVGFANQGESFLLWDKNTAQPVTKVISWQDSRTETLCKEMQEKGFDSWFNTKTGLHLSSEWPALKIKYLREEDPKLDLLCKEGTILYGQLDAWFLYNLSENKEFATDHGTASRSGIYNINTLDWDKELLEFFKAEDLNLPKIVDNTSFFKGIDLGIGKLLPWVAGGIDQAVCLIGQLCLQPKTAKITYGTCCSCWMNLGNDLLLDDQSTTSIAWKVGSEVIYALAAEGGAAGSVITWLNKNFHTNWPVEKLSSIASQYNDQPELIFIPAFNGLAAPYWEPKMKGTILGVTADTKPEHILRAGIDGIVYTVCDMLLAMPNIDTLVVDGGMTDNDYLIQKQADVLNREIIKTGVKEGTITGIAYLTCLSLGFFASLDEISNLRDFRVIEPDQKCMKSGYKKWKKAIDSSIAYYKSIGGFNYEQFNQNS